MDFTKAQYDMRKSYFSGGPRAFASGIVRLPQKLVQNKLV
jgi:hypothetical protein